MSYYPQVVPHFSQPGNTNTNPSQGAPNTQGQSGYYYGNNNNNNNNNNAPQQPSPAPVQRPQASQNNRLEYMHLRRCDLRGFQGSNGLPASVTEAPSISESILGVDTRGIQSRSTPLSADQIRTISECSTLSQLALPANSAVISQALANPSTTQVEDHLEKLIRDTRLSISTKKEKLQEAVAAVDKDQAERIAAQQALELEQEKKRLEEQKQKLEDERIARDQQKASVEDRKRQEEARKERETDAIVRRDERRRQQDAVYERLAGERNKRNRSSHNSSVQLYSDTMLATLFPEQKESVQSFAMMTEVPLDDDMLTVIKLMAFAKHFHFKPEQMIDAYFSYNSLDDALSQLNIYYELPPIKKHSGDFVVCFVYENGSRCNRLFDEDQIMCDVFVDAFVHAHTAEHFHLILDDGTKYTFCDEKMRLKDSKINPQYAIDNVVRVSVYSGRG